MSGIFAVSAFLCSWSPSLASFPVAYSSTHCLSSWWAAGFGLRRPCSACRSLCASRLENRLQLLHSLHTRHSQHVHQLLPLLLCRLRPFAAVSVRLWPSVPWAPKMLDSLSLRWLESSLCVAS